MFKNKFSLVAQLFSIHAMEPTGDNLEQDGELAMTEQPLPRSKEGT